MPACDIEGEAAKLLERYGAANIKESDVVSAIQYPKVFEDYIEHHIAYGKGVSDLPTPQFVQPMSTGEEFDMHMTGHPSSITVKYTGLGDVTSNTNEQQVHFEVNGVQRTVYVKGDKPLQQAAAAAAPGAAPAAAGAAPVAAAGAKADKSNPGHVGASMPGSCLEVRVAAGDVVKAGQPLVMLEAMKMETLVGATIDGTVSNVLVSTGQTVAAGDLLVELQA
jgi:pyruvate carboxylase